MPVPVSITHEDWSTKYYTAHFVCPGGNFCTSVLFCVMQGFCGL